MQMYASEGPLLPLCEKFCTGKTPPLWHLPNVFCFTNSQVNKTLTHKLTKFAVTHYTSQ